MTNNNPGDKPNTKMSTKNILLGVAAIVLLWAISPHQPRTSDFFPTPDQTAPASVAASPAAEKLVGVMLTTAARFAIYGQSCAPLPAAASGMVDNISGMAKAGKLSDLPGGNDWYTAMSYQQQDMDNVGMAAWCARVRPAVADAR